MRITGASLRRRVDGLDATVPFYEQLTGQQARRFVFCGAELAAVGPFLLFSAPDELGDRLARVIGTVSVDDLDGCAAQLANLGADLIAAPSVTPNGRRLIARHPDGCVVEYVGR